MKLQLNKPGAIDVEDSGEDLVLDHELIEAEQSAAEEELEPTQPEIPELINQHERLPDWTGKDVFIGFPSLKATNPATTWCLMAIMRDLGKDSVAFDLELGDSMVYHSRNRLAMKFLEQSTATYLLFIDDDMILPVGRPEFIKKMCGLPATYPNAALAYHTVHRLMEHKKTLVGANYYTRHFNGRPVNALGMNPKFWQSAKNFENKVHPCDWVGTGCMLIHRQVFLDMQKKFPELAPENSLMPWDFFHPDTNGKGEDMAFCRRAKECGHQPHVDSALHALHVGFAAYGVHTAK